MPPNELVTARSNFARAQAGPAAQLAPSDLDSAKKSLDQAEASFKEEGDSLVSESSGDLLTIRTHRNEVRVPTGSNGAPSATDIAAAIDFSIPPVIGDVLPGTPAAKAGLLAKDIIIELAGRKVENVYDYTYAIEALKVGQETEIVVQRGSVTLRLKITPLSRQ